MKLGLCGTSNISKTYLKSLNYLGHQIEIVYGNDFITDQIWKLTSSTRETKPPLDLELIMKTN